MEEKDVAELVLVLGLEEFLDGAGGKLGEGIVSGGKTVNGPSPLSVPTRSAAPSAAASVLNEPAATAVSTMSGRTAAFTTGA